MSAAVYFLFANSTKSGMKEVSTQNEERDKDTRHFQKQKKRVEYQEWLGCVNLGGGREKGRPTILPSLVLEGCVWYVEEN